MRSKVDHRALSIAGYVEPWTGGPGLRELSLSAAAPIDAFRIRRIDRDDMPAVDWTVQQVGTPHHQSFAHGAFATLTNFAALGELAKLNFELKLTRNAGRRVLLDAGTFTLVIDGEALLLVTGTRSTHLGTLRAGAWLSFAIDWENGKISVDAIDPHQPFHVSAPFVASAPSCLVLCSDKTELISTLNCRLAQLHLKGANGEASWQFPTLFTATPMVSNGVSLGLSGNPTFCVTSPRWDGTALDPRLAPTHYDAVHFHDTDIAGLDWPVTHQLQVPIDAESGVYAFELVSGETTERIPFFVAPSAPTASLAFVAPTATYLAYADEYLPPHLYEWVGTDRGHEFARDNQLRSLYDYHGDGSGVSLVSTRKPKATLRDDYRYPLCGDPHNLPVDLHFLKFCARQGIAIDVLTDADLHMGGLQLVARYRAVLTGSHPEYLSVQMEQAYRDFVANGGHLAYLGGNGFAATVAYRDDLMELRRGPTQSGRTWDGPLAEMNLALTNEPGGYLRDRGKGEYNLVGVGIALMGFSPALPYQRAEASYSNDFAWLFDGVDDTFGETGIVQGAAAGYEVDAVNFQLGSPSDIVILATATGFPDSYVDDAGKWFEGGSSERLAHRRCDMTYRSHASGGSIFTASSVSFLGGLPHRGHENSLGRLVLNLLRHISMP